MTQRHCVLLISSLVKVKGLKLGNLTRVCNRLVQLRPCHALKPLYSILQRLVLFRYIRSSRILHNFFLLKLNLLVQLSDQLLIKLCQLVFVRFKRLPKRDKLRQSLRHQVIFRGVWNLDKERDWH